jgi:hypothetical protein
MAGTADSRLYAGDARGHKKNVPGRFGRVYISSSAPESERIDTPRCVCLILQYLLQSCSRGGGQWRTCATSDYEPRPVWTSLPTISFTKEGR